MLTRGPGVCGMLLGAKNGERFVLRDTETVGHANVMEYEVEVLRMVGTFSLAIRVVRYRLVAPGEAPWVVAEEHQGKD